MEIGAGTNIGGYRLDQLIGQGGMGVVYSAESTQNGARVAVKLLTPELARQPGFRERFVREARYANSLNHPNVIEVYDAGEQDGVLYIAMQFVEGTDLKNLLTQQGALDARRTVRLLGQVADALDVAHSQGLLHRDIKPGNIMITGDDHCFLTDFGLSKNVSSDSIALTAQGEFVGTIDYTAPELVLGKEADSRLDVYSLGCLFYECLAGAPPFNKERDVEVLYAHIQDPPPKISEVRGDVPAGLDDVIAKAMAKKPEDRYATAREFMDHARAVIGEPPPPPPPPAGPPPPPPPPEQPAAQPFPAAALVMRATGGNAAGTMITVTDEFLIGRQAPGEGKLGNDIEISRRHARITREPDGRFVLEDLGSTNGTFVNGERVTTRALAPHDVIEMGDTRLIVLHPSEAPAMGEPEPAPAGPQGVTTFAAVPEEPTAEVEPAEEEVAEPMPEPVAEPVPEPVVEPVPEPVAEVPTEPLPPSEPPAPEPAPEPEPEPVPAPEPPPLRAIGVRFEVDPASGEATIEVDDPDGPVRFVKRDGEWSIEG